MSIYQLIYSAKAVVIDAEKANNFFIFSSNIYTLLPLNSIFLFITSHFLTVIHLIFSLFPDIFPKNNKENTLVIITALFADPHVVK